MKKKSLLLLLLVAVLFSDAQNVGINTTTPQATFDVRGSQRTGGISNYVKFDSATGKIEWVGASLFTASSQQIIRHSASSEGLYAGGGKLDYRNSSGNPVFYSDWTNGNGYFSGNLGIGTLTPTAKLQIRDGASGITPFFSARMVIETNNHTYINLLSPDPFETGVLFGSGGNAVSGLISYNSTTVPKGFIFNNNGNQTRMVIDNAGRVGIGTVTPQSTLDVNGAIAFNGNAGQNGQLLRSNGSGNIPSWTNPTKYYYFDQAGGTLTLSTALASVPGIHNQTFQVDFPADLIITFNGVVSNESATNIAQNPNIIVRVFAGGGAVGITFASCFLSWSATYVTGTNLTSSFHIRNAAPGLYSLQCTAQKFDGSGICTLDISQLRVQVIPQ